MVRPLAVTVVEAANRAAPHFGVAPPGRALRVLGAAAAHGQPRPIGAAVRVTVGSTFGARWPVLRAVGVAEAGLEAAVRVAAVLGGVVAVVALLAIVHDAVAARRERADAVPGARVAVRRFGRARVGDDSGALAPHAPRRAVARAA